MVSSFFWFLNALSKQYVSNIDVPIEYINIPQGTAQTNEMPSSINLRVNAFGFSILKHQLFDKDIPIYFDIEKNIGKRPGRNVIFFTNYHKEAFESDFMSDFTINQILPDSLLFVFDRAYQKKVEIVSDIEIDFEKQYQLKDMISFNPDSILISGPSYIIDTIDYVLTNKMHMKEVSMDKSFYIGLAPLKNVVFEYENTFANVSVEKYTERMLLIPIKFVNIPKGITIIPSEEKVAVKFNVGLSKYNDFTEDSFDAIVDCSILSKNPENLKIQFSHPFEIKVESYFPQEINYFLKMQ